MLKELYLGCNRIGDTGAAALAGVARGHNARKYLDLRRNGIGDEGAAALANVPEVDAVRGRQCRLATVPTLRETKACSGQD